MLLADKLGDYKNDVTEELVIVLSSVKGISVTDVPRENEKSSTSARGSGARGQGPHHGPRLAFLHAFRGIHEVYTALKKLRIVFTDIRMFNVEDEVLALQCLDLLKAFQASYQQLTYYMQWFRAFFGSADNTSQGLISAANVYQRKHF